ncbi:MAG: tetratricopeptide repeat protein [Cyanobacteria bacterium SZAS LIN-3]|nr:tetratricopeptide repeat protein [Cyanobacteria bacterium SZAS LIN-3]MBS2005429.1 tetratricopeptide repeat protein [Cyanobacteria bacterium SZAS TMP-1]
MRRCFYSCGTALPAAACAAIQLFAFPLIQQALAADSFETLLQKAEVDCQTIPTMDRALRYADRALAMRPHNPEALVIKAHVLQHMQESEQALPYCLEAIRLKPDRAAAWQVKADILHDMHRDEEALVAIDTCLKLQDSSSAQCNRAKILNSLGRFSEAEKCLDALLAAHDDPFQRQIRINTCMRLGKWDKIIADATMLLKANEKAPLSYANYTVLIQRGQAYLKINQRARAIADFQRAERAFADKREAHQNLLDIYKATGNKAGAAEEQAFLDKLDGDIKPFR